MSKLHNRIQQRRESYQWDVANRIVKKADAVTVEDLQVKNMMKRCKPVKSDTGRFLSNGQSAKRRLNSSIADASWYCLTQKVECWGAKLGKRLYRVNPKYTSPNCSKCRNVDKNSRNGEKFICTNFGHTDDARFTSCQECKTSQRLYLPQKWVERTTERLQCPWTHDWVFCSSCSVPCI